MYCKEIETLFVIIYFLVLNTAGNTQTSSSIISHKETSNMTKQMNIVRLGLVSYANGLKIQEHYVNKLKNKQTPPDNAGTLLLLEHKPVYTIGIRSLKEYNKDLESELHHLGADFHKTNRGGLITFHGPGQLVAYPIVNLKHFKPSVKWFIESLEETIIQLCKQEFNLNANLIPKYIGVFLDNEYKVCALGVHCSQYITHHGLAINCNTNLTWFSHVTPCGITDKQVTSLSKHLNRDVSVDSVVPLFKKHFEKVFQCKLTEVDLDKEIKHLDS
uniref:Octanoyl-[acyl-carrier-protein]:protein N-octanoyltransferase LIPT2, mitochondrial n=1 Tax=Cacopsylla melanoneura TaxID=428564 RepID=A0A8D8PKY3_9HEMI